MRKAVNAFRELSLTALLVVAVFFVSHQVVENVQVRGHSMDSTLHDNELILVDTISYRLLHPPRRGDIIIFHPPPGVDTGEDFVKRVIGLPGDRVQVKRGVTRATVYINGVPLKEPYIDMSDNYDWGPGPVPKGDLFVLGDNRDMSYDSHLWGGMQPNSLSFLAQNRVIGRAVVAYWPLRDLRIFTDPSYAGIKAGIK